MIFGPSRPLSPVLFRYGIGALSGARVVDEDADLRTLRHGASLQQVEGVRLVVRGK
jgi:uncharacterized protein (DUF4213/DUF364 family)